MLNFTYNKNMNSGAKIPNPGSMSYWLCDHEQVT